MSQAPNSAAPFLEARHAKLRDLAQRTSTKQLEPLEALAEKDLATAAWRGVQVMAREGLLRAVVPEEYGGSAKDVETRAIVAAREGVAYGSGLADAMLALQGLGSLPITLAGTDEQRRTWLPKVAEGKAIAGFAVTEPETGSDIAAMTTRAKKTADGWDITGTKTFISNAGIADYYTIFAKSALGAGHRGITAFLVPSDTRGLTVEPLRLMAAHPVGTLHIGIRLPEDSVLGGEGNGFRLALQTLDRMRPTVAAAACGMADRALDEAIKRAQTRQQFGKPIGEHQGLRWKLAEAATELQAARLLVYRAAWLKDTGQERITLESAQAKLFATEAAQRIVDTAMQVHGGSGQVAGSVCERLYRDVRALRIYEGTSEVLRDIIGKTLLEVGEAKPKGEAGKTDKH